MAETLAINDRVNCGDSAIFRRLDFPLLGITSFLLVLFFLSFISLVKPMLKDKSKVSLKPARKNLGSILNKNIPTLILKFADALLFFFLIFQPYFS